MNMQRKFGVAALVVAALASATLAWGDAPAAGNVSIKDAQTDLAGGKYTECLQKIATLLATAPASPSADRAALFLLRGECLIQQKQTMAADALSRAASAYPPKDSKDGKNPNNKNGKYWKEIATANATSSLIKKSTDFKYTPTTGKDKTPLGIVDAT